MAPPDDGPGILEHPDPDDNPEPVLAPKGDALEDVAADPDDTRTDAEKLEEADLTAGDLDPFDDDPLEGEDPTPGERLDDGTDEGKTLPIESDGTLLEAPAAAVLDPGPPPITPGSSSQQHRDRVQYENFVNGQVEDAIARFRGQLVDAFLVGHSVELAVTDEDGNTTVNGRRATIHEDDDTDTQDG